MDLTKLDIGPCTIKYNDVDLGATDGGVKVTVKQNVEDVTVDQFGKMPVDKVDAGMEVTVEANLAEYSFDALAVALPNATVQDGTLGKKLVIGKMAGTQLAQFAKELVIHPTALAESDTSKDWVIYKAMCVSELNIDYEVTKKKIIKLVFSAIPDLTKTSGNYLCHFGVETIS